MDLNCRTGAEAAALLRDSGFARDWADLWRNSAGKNFHLSPDHARIWYDHYADTYEPCLVFASDEKGLTAIVPLAIRRKEITGVGANQAEYHGWLAADDDGTLLPALLRLLDVRFPRHKLRMRYLQPDLVEAYQGTSTTRGSIQFTKHNRPLRTLEAGEIQASLRKKNNKSRINRFKRNGELSFRRVTDTAEQLDLLRELVPLYDFRQGAVNRTTPFHQDPQKFHYFQQLIEEMGEHMHLTGMWLDGGLVSSHMGYIAANGVQIAIICHSPVHASHSPGRVHLLYLLELLQAEGFSHFDLTPGGDSWKDRSASFTDTVFELVHYTSPLQGSLADVSRVTNNLARRAIRGLGIDSAGLKRTVKRSRRLLRHGKPGNILKKLASEVELRVYSIQSRDPTPTVIKFRKNCLEDLLKFEAVESWQDKYDFLSDAMRRLESGEIAYSHADHDRLLSYFWLIPSTRKAVFSEVKQGIRLPEGSAVQYDAFTHPASRGKGLYQAAMTEGLSDAFQQHQATRVFVGVVSTNAASRHVIEKVGYKYNGSLHYSHWLRRVKMRFELPEHYRLED